MHCIHTLAKATRDLRLLFTKTSLIINKNGKLKIYFIFITKQKPIYKIHFSSHIYPSPPVK